VQITAEQDQAMLALERENQALKERLALLTFQVEQLTRLIYGAKSERYVPTDPGQSTLFEVQATAEPATEQVSYTRTKPGQKKQPVREAIAAHLPRVERVIEPEALPEGARKTCLYSTDPAMKKRTIGTICGSVSSPKIRCVG
jgi:transposase